MASARWFLLYLFLADLAAEGTVPVTYGTLSAILRHFQGKAARRDRQGHMLEKVREHCLEKGEPDLTAFVVTKATGKPSTGYAGGDPEKERKAAHKLHRVRVWGK